MSKPVRHILSLSGGKDSAALAIFMRDEFPDMEYIFHDTNKELPETIEYLDRLEAILGKKVTRTTPERSFEKWLTVYGGMIPSNHRRWCTKQLKLKPFEKYVGNDPVINYVALRYDERDRLGYISHKPNIKAVYPFIENKKVYRDIVQILEESGLGMPRYTEWGRTRSGCFFCFYQQKIEWVRLKETHPDLFDEAKQYEYANNVNGNPFYWNGEEPLEMLEKPERMAEIKANWERSQEKSKRQMAGRTLLQVLGQYEAEDEADREGCLICQI